MDRGLLETSENMQRAERVLEEGFWKAREYALRGHGRLFWERMLEE